MAEFGADFESLKKVAKLYQEKVVKGGFRAKTTRFRSATLPYLTLPLKYTNHNHKEAITNSALGSY